MSVNHDQAVDAPPARGVVPAPAMQTAYVRYPGGALGKIRVTGEIGELAAGGRLITRQEYDAALAELNDATAEHVAGLVAADLERTRGDYLELRAAGLTDGAARRMSGYDGPDLSDAVEAGE